MKHKFTKILGVGLTLALLASLLLTAAPVLAAPLGDFHYTAYTDTTATFEWSAQVAGVDNLEIEISTDAGATWTTAPDTTPTPITPALESARVNALNPNTAYKFRLMVTDGNNAGPSNSETLTTAATPIADFNIVGLPTTTTATFDWSAASGDVTDIIIEQSEDAGVTWTTAITDPAKIAIDAIVATVTGLTPNTDYTFRLVVTGGENEGPSDPTATATTASPVIETVGTIAYGEVDPSIEVTLTGDDFAAAAVVNNVSNWTFAAGDTGLELGSITRVDDTAVTVVFTGTAAYGIMNLTAEAAALSLNAASDLLTLTVTTTPVIATADIIVVGDETPSITVTLTGDDFADAADVQTTGNWLPAGAEAGLTLATITRVGDQEVTLFFTGTVTAGTLTLQAKLAALTGGNDSNTLTLNTAPVIATADEINFGDVAPSITVTLTGDTFADAADVQTTGNWLPAGAEAGLTLATITRVGDQEVELFFTGTAGAGTLTIKALAAALIGTEDSDELLLTTTPELTTADIIVVGDETPSITVTLTGDTFADAADVQDITNWTFDAGDTGLMLDSITGDGGTTVTVAFTGTVAAGTLTLQAKVDALIGTEDSDELLLTTTPVIATADIIVVGDETPFITVILTGDTFADAADAQDITNWLPAGAEAGLTLATITRVGDQEVKLFFTGTAGAGTLTIKALAAALIGTEDSDELSLAVTLKLALETADVINFGDVAPSITVTLIGGTFAEAADVQDITNWTFDAGDTGLMLDSITGDGGTTVTVAFTGTVAAGTLTLQAKAAALVGSDPSEELIVLIITTPVIDTVDEINFGDVAPSITVTLTGDIFADAADVQTTGNWLPAGAEAGLTLATITRVGDQEVELFFTGTAGAGTLTIKALAAALTGTVVSDELMLTITSDVVIETANVITFGDVDPSITVTLTEDTFSATAVPTLANWTFDAGDTGLTLGSVATEDSTTVTVNFTGTAALGTLTLVAKAAALTGELDSNILEVTMTPSATIELSAGWNFISVPKSMADGTDTFGELLAGIDVVVAYSYDSVSGWSSALTDATPVEVLEGYWIDVNTAGTITLSYKEGAQEVPASKSLVGDAWNAIGFSSTTARDADTALMSVVGSWSTVLGWDAEGQAYEDSIIVGETGDMLPGKGYWIWMTEDDVLSAISG